MELQAGFKIKMLTAISAGDIFIPKNDVVEVIEVGKKGIVVQDILDNKVILPKNARYRIIKSKRAKAAKLTAAPIPLGSVYRQARENVQKSMPSSARTRAVQLAQVVTSTALSCEDPMQLSRLAIAGNVLSMALNSTIDTNQFNRLYQFARKLSRS